MYSPLLSVGDPREQVDLTDPFRAILNVLLLLSVVTIGVFAKSVLTWYSLVAGLGLRVAKA